jgi:hypothetical protein
MWIGKVQADLENYLAPLLTEYQRRNTRYRNNLGFASGVLQQVRV